MKIEATILEKLIEHAKAALPAEACGYLAAKDGVVVKHYELTNTDNDPEHYSMDPKEQFDTVRAIRADGLSVAAVYHSHPVTPARPSQEDIALAYDPTISYVIVSLAKDIPYAKSFRIQKGEVRPEELTLV